MKDLIIIIGGLLFIGLYGALDSTPNDNQKLANQTCNKVDCQLDTKSDDSNNN